MLPEGSARLQAHEAIVPEAEGADKQAASHAEMGQPGIKPEEFESPEREWSIQYVRHRARKPLMKQSSAPNLLILFFKGP